MDCRENYKKVSERGNWFDVATREEIVAYQQKALRKILKHATKQVPAYFSLRSTVDKFNPFEALTAFLQLKKRKFRRTWISICQETLIKFQVMKLQLEEHLEIN